MANVGFDKADSACVREDGERRVVRDTEPALFVSGKEQQTSSSSGEGDVAELIELVLVIDGTSDSVCYLLVHIQEFSKFATPQHSLARTHASSRAHTRTPLINFVCRCVYHYVA